MTAFGTLEVMWKWLLLSASLGHAQFESMECSNVAAAQTRTAAGPSGLSAALKVSSADDFNKELHLCMAEYKLLFKSAAGDAPTVVNLISTDADWGRHLSAQLAGFSSDGKRIFAMIAEDGQYPAALLFQYDIAGESVKTIDLKKALIQLAVVKCGTPFAVAGTTGSGAIVLKPATTDKCSGDYLWQIDPASGELQRLSKETRIDLLYPAEGR